MSLVQIRGGVDGRLGKPGKGCSPFVLRRRLPTPLPGQRCDPIVFIKLWSLLGLKLTLVLSVRLIKPEIFKAGVPAISFLGSVSLIGTFAPSSQT